MSTFQRLLLVTLPLKFAECMLGFCDALFQHFVMQCWS